jgi:hypothetical protein
MCFPKLDLAFQNVATTSGTASTSYITNLPIHRRTLRAKDLPAEAITSVLRKFNARLPMRSMLGSATSNKIQIHEVTVLYNTSHLDTSDRSANAGQILFCSIPQSWQSTVIRGQRFPQPLHSASTRPFREGTGRRSRKRYILFCQESENADD